MHQNQNHSTTVQMLDNAYRVSKWHRMSENMAVAFLHSDIGILLINKLNFAFHFALSSDNVSPILSLLGKIMAG